MLAILLPVIIESPYVLHLLILVGIFSIVTLGFIMQLRAGLINLGTAVFWGIGAYTSALLAIKLGVSFWFCMLIAGMVTAIVALGIGFIILRTGIIGFLMLTIAINVIFIQILGQTSFVGGWNGLTDVPHPALAIPFYGQIEFGVRKIYYYYLILLLLLFTIVNFNAIYKSRIGTALKAIGLDPALSSSVGINLFVYKLSIFAFVSFFAGLAGSFYAHYQGFIVPETFDIWSSVMFQIYPIVGGLSYNIAGGICGTFVLIIIPELLHITRLYAQIFYGVIIIFLVIFFPRGISNILDRIIHMGVRFIKP
jgi:branched-chain amino acid transport system permease protein